ncbi:type 1 glutamine amidotransferase [Roseovarius sp.]|uniref:type 1 glutamine amidotransferase n=1 Tax=Roseovarius sp. TaxID=1486281 RepID=UPI00262674E9|nr:type 1 glutamine amidotransferase [Roseovarius sp.]
MKIGILKTGHAPDIVLDELGDYEVMFADLLAGHGFEFDAYDVVDGDFPTGPEAADGWLITGSKHGAYENLPWIAPLEQLIRDIYADGRPLVGVCFGHQVIAQALGGTVEKFDGGWSVGVTEYEIEGMRLPLNAWHQDQVTALPEGASVVGSSAFCENAALVYGDRIYTIQPHPEFTATMVDRLIHHRGPGVVPEALLQDAAKRLDQPTANAEIAKRMAKFLKRGA